MNVHGPRKIGRPVVIQPVVIGKPGVPVGNGYEIAGPGMVQPMGGAFLPVEDGSHSVCRLEERAHLFQHVRVVHVYVRYLMIRDCEGPAGACVKEFASQFFTDPQESFPPENAVERHGSGHGRNAVFRQDDDSASLRFVVRDEFLADPVNPCHFFGYACSCRSLALQYVIEMGQVDERHAGMAPGIHVQGRAGNPFAGADGRSGSPELE